MMKKRGLTLNAHQTLVVRLRYIAEYVIRSLNEFGWAVVDNFLGDEHCRFTYKADESVAKAKDVIRRTFIQITSDSVWPNRYYALVPPQAIAAGQ
ncbi:hypothetical protein OSTOST_24133, partial [Ostertagia ostertagi]